MIKTYNEFIEPLNEEINLKTTLKMLLLTGVLTVSYMTDLLANKKYDNKYVLQTYKELLKETGKKEDKNILNLFQSDTVYYPAIIFAVDTTAHPDVYYFKRNPDGSYSKNISNEYISQMNGYVDNYEYYYDANMLPMDKKYKIVTFVLKDEESIRKEKKVTDLSGIINDYLYTNFKIKADTNTKLYEIGLDDEDVFHIIVYVEEKLGIRVNDNDMINILLNKNLTLKELIDFIKKYIKT